MYIDAFQQGGTGSALDVLVTLAMFDVATLLRGFSYDAPVIRSVQPNSVLVGAKETVTVNGENFGIFDTSPHVRIGPGPSLGSNVKSGRREKCEESSCTIISSADSAQWLSPKSVVWISDSNLQIMVEPHSGVLNQYVVVYLSGQTRSACTF